MSVVECLSVVWVFVCDVWLHVIAFQPSNPQAPRSKRVGETSMKDGGNGMCSFALCRFYTTLTRRWRDINIFLN